MNRHIRVLEQRIESATIDRGFRQVGREGILVDDHHEQEEELNGPNNGDHIWDQLALALPVGLDRDRPKDRQQEHPEHDRAVETAPVRGQLVEERLDRVGVPVDVANGVILRDECVDDDRGRERHQRGDGIERTDPALDEPQ